MDARETQPMRIGLAQFNNSFSGQNYLPYSVGLLQAYVQRHAPVVGRYEFLVPLYKRMAVSDAVERLRGADVVGFSAYVWNIQLSLEVARRLKAQRPEVFIVFGGPQVPDRAEAFLRENPCIDVACHGEGERVFLDLLERLPSRHWDGVGSISYLREGQFISHPRVPRTPDLGTIPSPYLEGAFGPLMEAFPEERWLALWETNRGCPFSCTFCDWGSATAAKVFQFDMPRLLEEIEWFAGQKIEFVFCCDANFGMLPRDLDLTRHVAETKARLGYPQALSVQNTKNATERAYQVQKLLADAGLNKGVSISLQTVDAPTLKAIKRQNISSASFEELQRRFTRDGVETYSDLILGLPEETYESFVEGVSRVIENGQHNRIQFNNLSILPNAEMGDPEYRRRYGMETVRSKIINIHGSLLVSDDDVQEYQDLVIATGTMPRSEWRRTRAFCWMAALLHFDKVLQVPLVVIHELTGMRYRQLIEAFTQGDLAAYPTLRYVRSFFERTAWDIQDGGEEYCRSPRWLNIYWPADELIFIQLCTEDRLDAFYDEAASLLKEFVSAAQDGQESGGRGSCRADSVAGSMARQEPRPPRFSDAVLDEAVALNRSLIKLPFQTTDLDLELAHNIWEFYRGALDGLRVSLEPGRRHYHIDRTSRRFTSWEEWCQQVVWYGNKKGAYLYSNQAVEPQYEGHF